MGKTINNCHVPPAPHRNRKAVQETKRHYATAPVKQFDTEYLLSVPEFTANLYCICLGIDVQYT